MKGTLTVALLLGLLGAAKWSIELSLDAARSLANPSWITTRPLKINEEILDKDLQESPLWSNREDLPQLADQKGRLLLAAKSSGKPVAPSELGITLLPVSFGARRFFYAVKSDDVAAVKAIAPGQKILLCSIQNAPGTRGPDKSPKKPAGKDSSGAACSGPYKVSGVHLPTAKEGMGWLAVDIREQEIASVGRFLAASTRWILLAAN